MLAKHTVAANIGKCQSIQLHRKAMAVLAIAISWAITSSGQPASAEQDEYHRNPNAPSIRVTLTDRYRDEMMKQISYQWHNTTGPILKVVISNEGLIMSVGVVKSSGNITLDKDAIKIVKATTPSRLPAECVSNTITIRIDLNRSHPHKTTSSGFGLNEQLNLKAPKAP